MLAGELFKIDDWRQHPVHVPYRGAAPALTDLLAGQVQVYFVTTTCVDRLHQDRKATRAGGDDGDALGGAAGYSDRRASFCRATRQRMVMGLARPRHTPAEIVEKLNKEINAALADPKMKARLADLGGTVLAGSPADFGKLIAEETEKWGKVGKSKASRRSDPEQTFRNARSANRGCCRDELIE